MSFLAISNRTCFAVEQTSLSLCQKLSAEMIYTIPPRHAGEPQQLVVNQGAVGAQPLPLAAVSVLSAAHRLNQRDILFGKGTQARGRLSVHSSSSRTGVSRYCTSYGRPSIGCDLEFKK